MEAMTRMECFKVTWIRTGRLPQVLSWKNPFTPLPPPPPPLLPLHHILLLQLLQLQHLPHPLEYRGLLPFCRAVLQTIWAIWLWVFFAIQQICPSMLLPELQTGELQLHLRRAFSCLHKFLCQSCAHTWRTCELVGGELQ